MHILTNTVQQGCNSLPINIESQILRIYNHFYVFTPREEKLNSFCSFEDVQYKKNCYTRGLTLFFVIRILEVYEGLTSCLCLSQEQFS